MSPPPTEPTRIEQHKQEGPQQLEGRRVLVNSLWGLTRKAKSEKSTIFWAATRVFDVPALEGWKVVEGKQGDGTKRNCLSVNSIAPACWPRYEMHALTSFWHTPLLLLVSYPLKRKHHKRFT